MARARANTSTAPFAGSLQRLRHRADGLRRPAEDDSVQRCHDHANPKCGTRKGPPVGGPFLFVRGRSAFTGRATVNCPVLNVSVSARVARIAERLERPQLERVRAVRSGRRRCRAAQPRRVCAVPRERERGRRTLSSAGSTRCRRPVRGRHPPHRARGAARARDWSWGLPDNGRLADAPAW